MMTHDDSTTTRSVGLYSFLPSCKRLHNYGKRPSYQWENSLLQWPFSIAMLVMTRGYAHQKNIAASLYMSLIFFGGIIIFHWYTVMAIHQLNYWIINGIIHSITSYKWYFLSTQNWYYSNHTYTSAPGERPAPRLHRGGAHGASGECRGLRLRAVHPRPQPRPGKGTLVS